MPPTPPAMPMPMKPMAAPEGLAAAVRMASLWAAAMLAAAIAGLAMTAAFWRSRIICSWSSGAEMVLTPKAAISRPRRSLHWWESSSFRASASSLVWAGTAL